MGSAYARLFDPLVFPVLDRLNRTTIHDLYHDLLRSERLDPDERRRTQQRKLEATIAAAGTSAFYAKHWKHASRERRLPSLHKALDGLPVVTKSDIAAAHGAFPERGYRGRVITSRTSGSTGHPMTFYRSAEQESWFWALRFRIWHWSGYRPGDPYLEINLNPRVAWRKRLQDILFRCTYLTFNADNQDSERIMNALHRRRIPNLNGFASSLYVLARYMLTHGAENPGVRGITSTGDGMYPTYREAVESAFGVRVFDYYGAGGEGIHVASQCAESGTRYHIHPENVVLEVLGAEGPAPPGTPGRLIVTQLDNAAMPLIRYDLEDCAVAAPPDDVCPCGRTLPMLQSVEGRVPDLVAVPNGSFLVPHFFVVLFKNLQEVATYQIVQDEAGSILVRLAAHTIVDRAATEATVRRAIAEATGNALAVQFEWVAEIPLSGAGKRRLIVSSVSRRAMGVESARSS